MKVKVKQFWPGLALTVPQISRQSAHEVGTFVSPYAPAAFPPGDISGTYFC